MSNSEQQARAYMDTIIEMAELDHDEYFEQAHGMPLEVSYRSGWKQAGSSLEPEEFLILLSTGGPAVRITGDLDRGTPVNAHLEHQDWGTDWTPLFLSDDEQEHLRRFCDLFCYEMS
jgi:hypothetical protein